MVELYFSDSEGGCEAQNGILRFETFDPSPRNSWIVNNA